MAKGFYETLSTTSGKRWERIKKTQGQAIVNSVKSHNFQSHPELKPFIAMLSERQAVDPSNKTTVRKTVNGYLSRVEEMKRGFQEKHGRLQIELDALQKILQEREKAHEEQKNENLPPQELSQIYKRLKAASKAP